MSVQPPYVQPAVVRYEPSQATKILIALWMLVVLIFSGVGAYAGVDWLMTKARIRHAVEQFGTDLQRTFSTPSAP
jgi:hypothetical protein